MPASGAPTGCVLVLRDRPRYVNVLLFLSPDRAIGAIALVTVVCLDRCRASGWAGLVIVLVMSVVMFVALGVAPRTLGASTPTRWAVVPLASLGCCPRCCRP